MNTPNDISKDKDAASVQPKLQAFPRILMGGKMRGFNSTWYLKHDMIEYSLEKDKIYCFCCRHFSPGTVSSFITGYSDWRNMGSQFDKHFNSAKLTRQFAFERYSAYFQSKASGLGTVVSQINKQHKNEVLRNREILATHAEVILFYAQQNIVLRGHKENDESDNRGNFIELLELLKRKCPDFKTKSDSMPQNAKYIHNSIQNEIIDCSVRLVKEMILKEVNGSRQCFSIIADETKDSGGTEQLSFCLRYLHGKGVQERFVAFADIHSFDAESISSAILKIINESGLCISNCVAQSYDGASAMSGDTTGVKTRLEEAVGGTCVYVHCYAHRLNLVLVDCCKNVPEVRDLLGLLQAMYNFQCNSVLRSEYFQESQKESGYLNILKMPQSCHKRWSSKKKGLHYFRSRFDAVILVLELLIQKRKPDEAAECRGYLNQVQSFNIIILLIIMDEILETTNSLSEYLQYSQLVYTRAVTLCQATITTLAEMKTDLKFTEIWKEASKLAEKVFIETPIPSSIPGGNRRRKIISKRLKEYHVLSPTGARTTEELLKKI